MVTSLGLSLLATEVSSLLHTVNTSWVVCDTLRDRGGYPIKIHCPLLYFRVTRLLLRVNSLFTQDTFSHGVKVFLISMA
jgi:hypothetical protein